MLTSSVFKNPSGEKLDFTFHSASRRDMLVILGHGLTANKDRPLLVALAQGLAARGWPCLRISFSGNGDSEGRFEDATITKEVADLRAILDGVPDWVRVTYVGHSMGSAVGVRAAVRDLRIQALVSLAGMARTAAFVEREFGGVIPGEGCMWDEPEHPLSQAFVDDMKALGDILGDAAKVAQPWLLVHGAEDDLVPLQDSRDAHAAAVCRKRLVEIPAAGHSFDETTYPRVTGEVDAWLTACFGPG